MCLPYSSSGTKDYIIDKETDKYQSKYISERFRTFPNVLQRSICCDYVVTKFGLRPTLSNTIERTVN